VCLFVLALGAFLLALPPQARADFPLPNIPSATSVSGQFLVTDKPGFTPLDYLPEVVTNQNLVRLEPALLVVSADRLRAALLGKLGVNPAAPWGAKIYLVIHPAQSLAENVEIVTGRFENNWEYHVLVPSIVPRDRLARALTGVLLLEYANRQATDHAAELPSWLVEGLTQELVAGNLQDMLLNAPDHTVNTLPLGWTDQTTRGIDSLAGAREVLQNYSVLTFSQLSWPTDAQLAGDDGGQYRASAQLFVDELLALPNGGAKLRTMLELLPHYYNWQTAFESTYQKNFSTPLRVEKWWALQSVIFASRSPGPQWTLDYSRQKLDEILSVPVQYRGASNAMPSFAEISLQNVIQNLNSVQQAEILQAKLRDLELAQLRVDPSLARLTAGYRSAVAGYLGEAHPTRGTLVLNKNVPTKVSAHETLLILNALDAQRRALAMAPRPGLLE
jgi:hypothetical protein